MERTLEYIITNEFHNKTIEQFLKAQEFPHQVVIQLKKTEEGILHNGVWAYVNAKLSTGDSLILHLVEEVAPSSIEPLYVPLSIVYEDEDIIVLDKPAGMPIHPSMNHHSGTVANGLVYYYKEQGKNFTFRAISRLDRDTSGLTLIAKHMLSGGILSLQIAAKEVTRTYRAICQGKLPSSGTIDAPISRVADSTIERCVDFENGEHAITHFSRLAYDEEKNLSLAELKLETGRTHQIRVHLKHLGNPIIGDFLYNPDYIFCSRQALHSSTLQFVHPITKKEMHFASPFPEDLKCIFPKF